MFFENVNMITPSISQGDYNFSMADSEYLPLVSSLGQRSLTNFFNTGHHRNRLTEYVDGLNLYMRGDSRGWGVSDREAALEQFVGYRNEFYQRIELLDSVMFKTSINRLENFHSIAWSRKLKKISYYRFMQGGGKQAVDGQVYSMPVRSLGFTAKGGMDGSIASLFYAFTFKTEYLEYLKAALYKGKPLDNQWFTLFLAPNIPGIAKEGQFTKPFSRDFIIPFETKGVEIKFEEDILNALAFKDVPDVEPPYVFKLVTKGRTKQQIEREQAMANFVSIAVDRIILQEDWDMGKNSENRALEQLRLYKENSKLRVFTAYIDDNFYFNVPLVRGMRRCIRLEDREIHQIYFDVIHSWKEEDESITPSDVNEICVYFTLNGVGHSQITPEFIASYQIQIEYMISNGNIYPYTEEAVTYQFGAAHAIYEITQYRAIPITLDTLFLSSIKGIHELRSRNTFYLDATGKFLVTYQNEMAKINWNELALYNTPEVYIMLSSDYLTSVLEISNQSFVYFVDEDNLYLKREHLLFYVDIARTIDCETAEQHIGSLILKGEGNLKALFLNKIAGRSLFRGSTDSHHLIPIVPIDPNIEAQREELIDGEGISITTAETDNITFTPQDGTSISLGGNIPVGNIGIEGSSSGYVQVAPIRNDARVNTLNGDVEVYDGAVWVTIASDEYVQASLSGNLEAIIPHFIGEQRVNENTSNIEVHDGTDWLSLETAIGLGIRTLPLDELDILRNQFRANEREVANGPIPNGGQGVLAQLEDATTLYPALTEERLIEAIADIGGQPANIEAFDESTREEAAVEEARGEADEGERTLADRETQEEVIGQSVFPVEALNQRREALEAERLSPTTDEAEAESDEPDGSIFDEEPENQADES